MKKIIMMLAVVAGLSAGASAATWTQNFNGVQTAEIGVSTPANTAILVAAGPGTVSWVSLSSATTAGDYCVGYDSGNVTGFTTAAQAGTLAAPMKFMIQATAAKATYDLPLPKGNNNAIQLYNGLVILCNKPVQLETSGTN